MGPESYKTYTIHAPLSTHFRRATCEEIGCPNYLKGWQTRIEGLPAELLHAVRNSGRKYTELRVTEGETWLVFEAGQSCFQTTKHRTRIDEPELYIVRDGDHRGNPRGTKDRLHQRPADWRDDFAEHQQGLADAYQEG
jgi:hypothetical protein